MKKAAILKISGRVQKVAFRYHTRKTAEEYRITGFVKNQPDGSVYIEAEGEEEDLDRFILWCQRGPAWARVDHINIQYMPVQGFEKFEVR